MGGIHPRLKKPVGDRLAEAAWNLIYGGEGARSGPTISSCTNERSKLTVDFDLGSSGETLLVKSYNKSTPSVTTFEVLTNMTYFCVSL